MEHGMERTKGRFFDLEDLLLFRSLGLHLDGDTAREEPQDDDVPYGLDPPEGDADVLAVLDEERVRLAYEHPFDLGAADVDDDVVHVPQIDAFARIDLKTDELRNLLKHFLSLHRCGPVGSLFPGMANSNYKGFWVPLKCERGPNGPVKALGGGRSNDRNIVS